MFLNSSFQNKMLFLNFADLTYTFVCLAVFIALYKINERSTLYIKTQYLVTLLISLTVPLLKINMNSMVPIFLLLELGTILFILLTLRGGSGQYINKSKKNIIMLVLLPTIFLFIYLINFYFIEYLPQLFVDLYRKTTSSNEFSIWALSITKVHTELFLLTCLLIVISTTFIVFLKTKSVYTFKKLDKIDIFFKIRTSFYFTKKNVITFFKSQ